jgi:hypothetical protein
MPTDLVPVKQIQPEAVAEKNLFTSVRKFRDVIEQFKNTVYENLESGKGLDKHNVSRLNEAVNKIIQLGNILDMYLLRKQPLETLDDATKESVASVKQLFASNGVDFDTLDDAERQQCAQIIEYDIRWYPYSVHNNHRL